MFRFKKISFFAIFRLFAVHVYFSSTIRIQKYTGFKKSAVLRCLDDLQIYSSNVFFINNPDPKLKLNPHRKNNNFGSTTLRCTVGSGSIWNGLGNIQIRKLRNARWGAFSLAYPVSISILPKENVQYICTVEIGMIFGWWLLVLIPSVPREWRSKTYPLADFAIIEDCSQGIVWNQDV
jgi:hypothetical protein